MSKLQFRVLYREFLFRMVDLEVLSADALGDSNKLLGRFASLLIYISMLLSLAAFGFAGMKTSPSMGFALTVAMEHFLIATTMLTVGLFAVLSWDSTFPDRRDILVLAPLPVRARTMFLAKVAAVATALTLTVGLLHAGCGLIWPYAFAMQARPQTLPVMTFDATPTPASAAEIQAVLTRDLHQALTTGDLAPGTGAGMTIAVYKRGDRRVFSYGAARPDSLFEVGSITKTFTALMLAQMAAQGRVRLDEPLRVFLPEGTADKPRHEEITLLDLATHRSSLPRAIPRDWQRYLSQRGVGRQADPAFAYSNLGFALLGYSLTVRAGMSYRELLHEQVTGPLGLSDTVVALSPEQEARLIRGRDARHNPVPWDEDDLEGAGAIRSTAVDLLKYLEANMHPEKLGGTLPQAMAEAHRERRQGLPGMTMALAWFHDAKTGTWLHGGAKAGFTSFAFFQPQRETAGVVLLNQGPDAVGLVDLVGANLSGRMHGDAVVSMDTAFVPAASGFPGLLRWYAAYWFTMLAAGAFIYCAVLGVQGLAAQLLPRRWFLRISGILQLGAFCLFVCVYFLQPGFSGLSAMTGPEAQALVRAVPSYWFVGLIHQLNGSMHPALAPLAQRAWIGLAVVMCGTAVAYALSYLRTLRKIVEEPDITPGTHGIGWLPPFGNRVQTAIGQFSVRTLMRSRQHRVILAFYFGIGFALAIHLLKTPEMKMEVADPNTPLMAASIALMALGVVGTRVVFAMPKDLRANWIFRIAGVRTGRKTLAASRRGLLLLSAAPVWVVTAAVCLRLWPWRQAAGHLVLLGLIGIILTELCLMRFRKIPFTCSYLPGKSQVHMVFLGALGLLYFVLLSVKVERDMLQDTRSMVALLVPFLVAAIGMRIATAMVNSDEEELVFEEAQEPAVLELGLHRDGVMPTGRATNEPRP